MNTKWLQSHRIAGSRSLGPWPAEPKILKKPEGMYGRQVLSFDPQQPRVLWLFWPVIDYCTQTPSSHWLHRTKCDLHLWVATVLYSSLLDIYCLTKVWHCKVSKDFHMVLDYLSFGAKETFSSQNWPKAKMKPCKVAKFSRKVITVTGGILNWENLMNVAKWTRESF